jgi:hypothetical protein
MLNSINPLVLPPHTSHELQPLDVGVFAPLKAAMKDLARQWVGEVNGPKARMSRYKWTRTLAEARGTAMAKHNTERGWEKSGIYPLNNTKVAPPIDDTTAADPQLHPLPLSPHAAACY